MNGLPEGPRFERTAGTQLMETAAITADRNFGEPQLFQNCNASASCRIRALSDTADPATTAM